MHGFLPLFVVARDRSQQSVSRSPKSWNISHPFRRLSRRIGQSRELAERRGPVGARPCLREPPPGFRHRATSVQLPPVPHRFARATARVACQRPIWELQLVTHALRALPPSLAQAGGDRTRTCDPWPPRLVLIRARPAELRNIAFVGRWLEGALVPAGCKATESTVPERNPAHLAHRVAIASPSPPPLQPLRLQRDSVGDHVMEPPSTTEFRPQPSPLFASPLLDTPSGRWGLSGST